MTLPPTKLVTESLWELVLPSALAALVCVPRVRVLAALALVCGWAAGNHFRSVVPWLPDRGRLEWLPWLVAGAAALGTLARTRLPRGAWWVLFAAGLAFAVGRLRFDGYPAWFAPAFVAYVAAGGAGLLHAAERRPGVLVPLTLSMALAAGGGLCLLAHTARVMDAAMLGAVPLSVVACVAAARGHDAGAAAPPAVLLLAGTLFIGYHEPTHKIPAAAFVLAAAAPLLAMLPLRRWVVVLLVAAALGVAVGLAAYNDPIDFADYESL